MKVLVTGGCGFIGSNTVDSLIQNGHDVVVIDNLSTGYKENLNKNAKFYLEDINNKNIDKIFEIEKPEVIYHFAAQIDIQLSVKDPILDAKNNILGTINVLDSMKNHNVRKIIYSSSAAVYGVPNYLPIDEKHSTEPISFYGISKLTPELYIKNYSNLYNFKYSILRYANAYGIRQDAKGEGGVIAIFINKLLNNESPRIFGDGTQTRDFIFIKDIVNANLSVLDSSDNTILNVSNNISIDINKLFREIKDILNSNVDVIYEDKRAGDIKDSVLDNTLIKNIGFEPKYNLRRGLEETIEYYKNIKKDV